MVRLLRGSATNEFADETLNKTYRDCIWSTKGIEVGASQFYVEDTISSFDAVPVPMWCDAPDCPETEHYAIVFRCGFYADTMPGKDRVAAEWNKRLNGMCSARSRAAPEAAANIVSSAAFWRWSGAMPTRATATPTHGGTAR